MARIVEEGMDFSRSSSDLQTSTAPSVFGPEIMLF